MQQIEGCPDQELLDAYGRGGEEAAFAEIVRRHSRWVFAAAYRQLRDRQLAEDAVQVVFVLLATKAKHLEKDVKLSGWLFNATQFTVRNFRRMDRRRAARELAAQRREIVAESSPDSEMAARLDEAVAKLPTKDRTAVLLRFYQEQSIEEVAQAMGVSQAAAGKRVQRAVAALRRLLGIRGEDAVGMLAGYGIAHYPAELNHVVCRVALAAKAGSPLPAGIAAGAKGTGSLMVMAKLKMITTIAAGVAVIAAPVSIIAVQSMTRAAPLAQSPATQPVVSPAMAEALKLYSLQDDEVVRYLPPPFAAGRDEFMIEAQKPQAGRGGVNVGFGGGGGGGGGGFGGANIRQMAAPAAAVVLWGGNQPARITAGMGGRRAVYSVQTVLENMVVRLGEEVVGDRKVLAIQLPGDFVQRRGATQEQIMAALEKIISKAIQQPCTIKIAETPSDVYVLRGQWKFKALDNNDGTQILHLFGKDMSNERGQGNGMLPSKMFAMGGIGRFIHAPVEMDAKDVPSTIFFTIHYEGTPPDAKQVLDHVAQQTGLTWTKEKKNMPKITVETVNPGVGL